MHMPLKNLIIADEVADAPFSQRLIGEAAEFCFAGRGTELFTPDTQEECIRLLWTLNPECSMLISSDGECIRESMTLGFTTVCYGYGAYAPDVILGFEDIVPEDIYRIYNHANMLPVSIVRTERLLIRELSVNDTGELFGWEDCHYYSGSEYEPAASFEEFAALHRRYIRNQYGFYGFGLWGLFVKAEEGSPKADILIGGEVSPKTDILIGEAGIVKLNEDGSAELAYAIKPEFRNAGYATEALLAIKRVAEEDFEAMDCFVKIEKGNEASLRVAEKAGVKIISV